MPPIQLQGPIDELREKQVEELRAYLMRFVSWFGTVYPGDEHDGKPVALLNRSVGILDATAV